MSDTQHGETAAQRGSETTSTATRWRFTNDALAGLLLASTVAAVGASLYLTGRVPELLAWVFGVESLLAATWAFGRETLSAVGEIVPSPYGGQPAQRRAVDGDERTASGDGSEP
jgi:hypothetical protein